MARDIAAGTLSWIYTGAIMGAMCVRAGSAITALIENKGGFYYIADAIFASSDPVQYVLALWYFRTRHFELHSSGHIGITLNLSTLAVAGATAVDVTLLGGSSSVFEIVCGTYGRLAVYTVLSSFVIVFWKHCSDVSAFIRNTLVRDDLSETTHEVLKIRRDMEDSVNRFVNVFSVYTVTGAVGLAMFAEAENYAFPWRRLAVFCVVQSIYIVSVLRTKALRSAMNNSIRRQCFVDRFIRRLPVNEYSKFQGRVDHITLNISEENSSVIDWMVLDKLLDENWVEFTVMGLDISDGALIRKGLMLVAAMVTALALYGK